LKNDKLLLSGVAILVIFSLTSSFSLYAPAQGNNILLDPNFQSDVWQVSNWNNSYVENTINAQTFDLYSPYNYNGLGTFQGAKPYNWQTTPQRFEPLLITNKTVAVSVTEKLIYFNQFQYPDSQCNLGVDMWFNVSTSTGFKVAEIYAFTYQSGATTTLPNIIDFKLRDEQVGQHWLYLPYRVAQFEMNKTQTATFKLNALIEMFNTQTLDKSYNGGNFTLIGVDNIMEVSRGQAAFQITSCNIYEE
jgi:hypothetical protein